MHDQHDKLPRDQALRDFIAERGLVISRELFDPADIDAPRRVRRPSLGSDLYIAPGGKMFLVLRGYKRGGKPFEVEWWDVFVPADPAGTNKTGATLDGLRRYLDPAQAIDGAVPGAVAELAQTVPRLAASLQNALDYIETVRDHVLGGGDDAPENELIADIRNALACVVDHREVLGLDEVRDG